MHKLTQHKLYLFEDRTVVAEGMDERLQRNITTMRINTTQNLTEAEMTEMIKDHFRRIQLVPYCIVMIVGVFANITVIVNGFRRRNKIRHYINYFVLSMASADLGVVLFQVPFAIFEYTLGIPNISQFTCKYLIQFRETFQGAAIFSVSFLAFVRALQVMNYPNKQVSKRICLILIVGIWLMSYLLCTLPLYFVYKVWPNGYCDAYWPNKTVKKVHLTLIYCLLLSPMVIATISYGYIMIKIRKTLSSNETVKRRNRNVRLLLLSLIVSCWITYVPLAILFMLVIYTEQHVYGILGWSVTSVFYVSGSAINPVVVLVTMPLEYGWRVQCTRDPRVNVPPQNLPLSDADKLKVAMKTRKSGVESVSVHESV